MKKLLFTIITLLLTLPLAFALSFVNVDSAEWKVVNTLCIANGVLPPSTVSPIPVSELVEALERIPNDKLDNDEKLLKEKLIQSLKIDPVLQGKNIGFDIGISIAPELYAQTQPVSKQYDYAYDIKDMQPFLPISLDFYLGDFGLAFADFVFISPGLKSQFNKTFGSNLDSKIDFQHEGVLNSGIAFGNDFIYGGIFRTRQSMGNGKTGNLMVGDNFSRQDYARLHFTSEWFDYTLNLTHFDQSKETASNNIIEFEEMKFNGMHQMQGIHRFEGKFFDKVRFSFQEGMMLNSTSPFDLRLLNPFVYFHGFYNFAESPSYNPGLTSDEANNYTAVELTITGVPHLAFNLQFLMDQIQLSGERDGKNVCPQAFGMLLNLESPWVIKDHYLNGWFEVAAIMPYTYLNLKQTPQGLFNTNLDMITGYHNSNQDEIGYAGYKYGGDSLVTAIGFDFGLLDVYSVSTSFTYLIHGKYGYGYQTIIPERGGEHINDLMFTGVGIENAEHRLISNIDVTWNAMKGLDFNCGLSFLHVFNLGCEKNKNLNSLQFKIGLVFDPVEMFL